MIKTWRDWFGAMFAGGKVKPRGLQVQEGDIPSPVKHHQGRAHRGQSKWARRRRLQLISKASRRRNRGGRHGGFCG